MISSNAMILCRTNNIFFWSMSNRDSEVKEEIPKENSQLKALFLKNGLLQAKQPCTNICQILTPVICLLFTYVINKLASDSLPPGSFYNDNPYPYVFGDYTLLDNYSKILDANNTPTAAPSRDNQLQWFIFSCQGQCNSTLLGTNNGSVPVSVPDGKSIFGSIVNSANSVTNFSIDYYNAPTSTVPKNTPFFLQSTNGNVNEDLYHNISTIEENSFESIKYGRNGLDSLPDGAATFTVLNNNSLQVSLSINDVRDLDMHRNNGVTKLLENRMLKGGGYLPGQEEIISAYGLMTLQNYISQAYIEVMTGTTGQSGWIAMRDTSSSSAFVDSLINTVAALIFPLALSLLFPVMLYGLVLEKEEKLVQMMKMNGMKISSYWFTYFIFNLLFAALTNLIFFVLGTLFLDSSFFTKTSPLLLILVALGWILSQIGLAAFLQTLLDKARSANIVGYIFAIWTMMVASTLNIGVYQIPNQFPGWLQAIPPFAFNRLFYLMLINCSDNACFTDISIITDEMKNCLVSLYVGALILFLLGAYLLQVLPQQFGVRQHPLFPFKAFWMFITCQKKISYSRPGRDAELKRYLAIGQEDPLSTNQRQVISRMNDSQSYPLVINNLRKLYIKQGLKGPYAAVKSFNLRVAEKETFGLLGPNGAGKTTLINMLTGMINPDYGNAWIGGYDINSNISKAQLQMGVCPQFDLLWPQLTVEEHLRFYARLKGIPGSELEERVAKAIEEVNLTNFRSFLSTSLSGGMKRRLSIAISLVGDPKIVFLDEPSTGLDPDNRRQIWQVLARCQDKRSLFLTTHMMEEADALCHRIGIITHGTLRTVGNQLRLKKDYGQGFRLSLSLLSKEKTLVSPEALHLERMYINLQDEKENQAVLRRSISDLVSQEAEGESKQIKFGIKRIADFVSKTFPGSSLSRVLGGSVIFKIPVTFKLSDIFIEMHGVQKELGVTNVSITDSSLEDVFINVVLKYDKIIDDEETGEMKLVTIEDEEEEELKIDTPPIIIIEQPQPAEEKYDSVIEKDHESIISEEAMKKQNGSED